MDFLAHHGNHIHPHESPAGQRWPPRRVGLVGKVVHCRDAGGRALRWTLPNLDVGFFCGFGLDQSSPPLHCWPAWIVFSFLFFLSHLPWSPLPLPGSTPKPITAKRTSFMRAHIWFHRIPVVYYGICPHYEVDSVKLRISYGIPTSGGLGYHLGLMRRVLFTFFLCLSG